MATFVDLQAVETNFVKLKHDGDRDFVPVRVNLDDVVAAVVPDMEDGDYLHVWLRDGKMLKCFGSIDDIYPEQEGGDD